MSLELLSMNNSTLALVTVVPAAVFLVLYLIYRYSVQEKTFEQVVEEQRQERLKEELQLKQEKLKKENVKKHKKWGKKAKEKTEQRVETVPEKEPEPVLAPEPKSEIEIIEPKDTVLPKKKQKGNQKPSAAKSTKSSAETAVPSLDAIEKKESPSNATKEKSSEEPRQNEPLKAKTTDVEKAATDSSVVAPSANAVSKKKKKVEQLDKDIVHVSTTSKLISLVKEAALDDNENQMLIDILLDKQKDASKWKKARDPEAAARKQFQEKEQALETKLQNNQNLIAKLKQELTQQRTMEKTYQEKLILQQKDLHALNLRLKQTQEQLATEKTSALDKLKQMEKIAEETLQAQLAKIKEEKEQLSKTIKRLESESKVSTLSAELEKMTKSREDLQKVHNLLVEQHTLIDSQHKRDMAALSGQVTEVNRLKKEHSEKVSQLDKELEILKQKCATLESSEQDLEHLAKDSDSAKSELTNLKSLFAEAKKHSQDVEAEKEALNKQLKEQTQNNVKLKSDFENLQAEVARLTQVNERGTGDGQEVLPHNGEMNGGEKNVDKKIIENHEKILQEKDTVLKQVYDDLSTYKSKVTSITEELELQKEKNNELREKNWKVMEALTASENTAEQKVAEAEQRANERVKQIQMESDDKLRLVQENNSSQELSDRLHQSECSLQDLQKAHHNLEAEHQSKVQENATFSNEMQQLCNLRTSLEDRLSDSAKKTEELKAQALNIESSCRSCLQRIFPNIHVENSLPHKEWCSKFEKEAVAALQVASSSNPKEVEELQARLSNFKAERDELKSKLSQYETVLSETEATLNRLQVSAKESEVSWKEKLHSKTQELNDLQEKFNALESSVNEAKTEKGVLEQKYEEVNQNHINLGNQIESKEKTIQELQKEIASVDRLKKELDVIKTNLDKEKKINKDFSTQMVRLNSLVKIGQESVLAEQKRVKELEAHLQAANVAKPNGTSSPTITETNEGASGKQ